MVIDFRATDPATLGSGSFQVLRDTTNRWDSTHEMIERALFLKVVSCFFASPYMIN